jgi:hypothetical protein
VDPGRLRSLKPRLTHNPGDSPDRHEAPKTGRRTDLNKEHLGPTGREDARQDSTTGTGSCQLSADSASTYCVHSIGPAVCACHAALTHPELVHELELYQDDSRSHSETSPSAVKLRRAISLALICVTYCKRLLLGHAASLPSCYFGLFELDLTWKYAFSSASTSSDANNISLDGREARIRVEKTHGY